MKVVVIVGADYVGINDRHGTLRLGVIELPDMPAPTEAILVSPGVVSGVKTFADEQQAELIKPADLPTLTDIANNPFLTKKGKKLVKDSAG